MCSAKHSDVRCQGERKSEYGNQAIPCPCIVAIKPESVVRRVHGWFENPSLTHRSSGNGYEQAQDVLNEIVAHRAA
jgi:hypothetical protein